MELGMQLDPKQYSINNLLNGRLFQIPEYQRAYSWGKKQRRDLFDDIKEVQRSKRDHFLATIVGLKHKTVEIPPDEYTQVDIVDGQQRITSIIILLKSIEKHFDKSGENEKIKTSVKETLIKSDLYSLILLQTNHDSSNIFSDYIRKGTFPKSANRASDKNLIDAIEECERFVEEWADSDKVLNLLSTLKNRLFVIYHEVFDEEIVYRVFEVLNSRGLEVRWLDKFKSQLMSLVFHSTTTGNREAALSEIRNTWRTIYDFLGLDEATGDEALRISGTLKSTELENRIVNQEQAAENLLIVADADLPSIASVANWVKEATRVLTELKADPRLRAVTKIGHARFLACSIKLRRYEPSDEARLMRAWEAVTFRIFGLHGADARHKVGDFVRLAQRVHREELSADTLEDEILSLGKDYPVESAVADLGEWNECYYEWQEELRYLLFRYEERLASERGEDLNEVQWKKIWASDPAKSIEHISPQSAAKGYVHNLGNLTILPPKVNSRLKDKPPLQKAEAYLGSGLQITTAVGNQIKNDGKWVKKHVEDRCDRILKFVLDEWG